jgi:hypothetical protein
MKFLKTLGQDLRERQIFPAVVLLTVLAVGIPIFASMALSKAGTPPPVSLVAPPLPAPKGMKPPAQELAVLNTPPIPVATTRHGSAPDAFREAGPSLTGSTVPAPGSSTPAKTTPAKTTPVTTTPVTTTPAKTTPAKTTPVTTTPAKTTPAKTTPAKTTPAKTTPAKTTPAKTTPKVTKPKSGGSAPVVVTPISGPATLKSTQAYTVNIDTNDANGTHVLSNVVRLAPLPAAQSPEVIYLGVLKNGLRAAFLFTNSVRVSSGQSPNGIRCLPSPSDCQIAELAPGQGMKLAPTSNTALIATFTFELMSIGAVNFSSQNAALQARDNVSSAGQTLLPLSSSTELTTMRFDDKIGALVPQSPSGGSTGATGSSGSSGSTGATG